MKSYKITKLEKNRKSILFNDLEHCAICGRYGTQLHEVYFGKNRQNSMQYGCVVPLCQEHHTGTTGVHFNKTMDDNYKQMFQKKFEESHSREEFMSIFKKNYL